MSVSNDSIDGGPRPGADSPVLPPAADETPDPARAAADPPLDRAVDTNDVAGASSRPHDDARDEAIMSPEASPWRTQRFNRRPLIVLGVVVVVIGALVGYAILGSYVDSTTDKRLSATPRDEAVLPRGTDSKRMAEDIIGTPHIGLIPDAEDPAPSPPAAPAAPAIPITSVVDEPPRPPPRAADAVSTRTRSSSPVEDDEWRQARVSALREALVAPRTIRFDHRASAEAPQGQDFVQHELARMAQQRAALGSATDPATAYQEAAAQAAQLLAAQHGGVQASPVGAMPMAAGGMAGPPGAPSTNASASSDTRNNLRAFGNHGNERWKLPNEVEDAPSAYMLRPGAVIGAVLDSAVNSDLPGPLVAHTAGPVYSSTGTHELLFPEGTVIYGEYSADVVFGQSRLLVAWERLQFPNDQTLDIGAMPGTDGVGRAGFEDQVNNHYFRLFSSALLLSLVTSGVTMSQTPSSASSGTGISAGTAMSQALGLQFGQVTAQLLQKNLNTAPTLEVRNGFRFNIVVTKDVVFRGPYSER